MKSASPLSVIITLMASLLFERLTYVNTKLAVEVSLDVVINIATMKMIQRTLCAFAGQFTSIMMITVEATLGVLIGELKI